MPPDAVLSDWLGRPIAVVAVAVLGALFGSFANVCILRMPPTDDHPGGLSVVRPGSRCGACLRAIRWYDNIPLVSYLWLRGRCRDCGAGFSARYLLVEAATAMLFVAVYLLAVGPAYGPEPVSVKLLRFCVFAAFAVVLVIITFIDLDHKLILDKITYPAIPAFYLLGLTLPGQDVWTGLIGIAVGYGLIRAIADGYYALTRREGLGYGDGKLLAVVGALTGWQGVVIALFLGSIIGSVVGVSAIALARWRGRNPAEPPEAAGDGAAELDADPDPDPGGAEPVPLRHVEIPFGPFLAAGAVAHLFLAPWLRVGFAGVLYP